MRSYSRLSLLIHASRLFLNAELKLIAEGTDGLL